MKANLKKLWIAFVFSFVLFVPVLVSRAQSYSVLFDFNGTNGGISEAGLTLSGNTLYGTTAYEGAHGGGSIFRINTDGTGFTNLYNFPNPSSSNSAGAYPFANLTVSGSTLYGTTTGGGTAGKGVVFAIQTDGTGYTNVHVFTATVNNTNFDGSNPYCNLLLISNTLFGTTDWGGPLGGGTVFAVQTDGTGFTNLHSFPNNPGNPLGGLVASGSLLYGTTCGAGLADHGAIFAMNMDGSSFTNLHIFTGLDGSGPQCGLLLASDTLYGTTFGGGPYGNGTVFAMKTNGTGFTNLHFFGAYAGFGSNGDGGFLYDTPILHGNKLYGTSTDGGSSACGTLFSMNTDGTGFTVYHNFTDGLDGGEPEGGLVLAGDTMYGVGQYGGTSPQSYGVVFSLSFAPQLTVASAGTNVIVSWPTNADSFGYGNFVLESSANIGPGTTWTAAQSPSIVGGNYIVTNSVASSQMFYRLRGH